MFAQSYGFEHLPSAFSSGAWTFVAASGSPIQVGDGLGLKQYELAGDGDVIGHVEGTAGYSSFVGYLPESPATISMAINFCDDPANHHPGHRAARRRSSD